MTKMQFPGRAVRAEALKKTRSDMVEYCRALDADQWLLPSKAQGWLVRDVVAHLGASSRVIFTPASIGMLFTRDIEGWNESGVEQRRERPTWEVLDEFETWSQRAITLATTVSATPLAHARMPIGELGAFPMGVMLAGALGFDQYAHLHHDIAPAVGVPAPPPNAAQLDVAIGWMGAVLANQLRKAPMKRVDAPVNLELTGPGGHEWHIDSSGSLAEGFSWSYGAKVSARAGSFVSWGTKRTAWRDADVSITGDCELAERVLDAINVV